MSSRSKSSSGKKAAVDVKALSFNALRSELKARGLSAGGNKKELQQRLEDNIAEEGGDDAAEYIRGMTIKELQSELQKLGMSTFGRKSELQARLAEGVQTSGRRARGVSKSPSRYNRKDAIRLSNAASPSLTLSASKHNAFQQSPQVASPASSASRGRSPARAKAPDASRSRSRSRSRGRMPRNLSLGGSGQASRVPTPTRALSFRSPAVLYGAPGTVGGSGARRPSLRTSLLGALVVAVLAAIVVYYPSFYSSARIRSAYTTARSIIAVRTGDVICGYLPNERRNVPITSLDLPSAADEAELRKEALRLLRADVALHYDTASGTFKLIDESQASIRLRCQVRRFVEANAAVVGLLAVLLLCAAVLYWRHRSTRRRSDLVQAVEHEVLVMLQQQLLASRASIEAGDENPVPSWIPIVHVRDTLTRGSNGRAVAAVWDEVAQLLASNSCVSETPRLVQGEQMVVWEWIAPIYFNQEQS